MGVEKPEVGYLGKQASENSSKNIRRFAIKVIHAGHMYHPSIGGCQVYLKMLSEKMAALGEDITVLAPNALSGREFFKRVDGKPSLPQREQKNGVNVIRCKISHRLRSLLLNKILKLPGGYRLRKLILGDAVEILQRGPFSPRMIWEIIKLRPDIVLTLSVYLSQTYFCYLAKKILGFKLVLVPSLQIPTLEVGEKGIDNHVISKILKASDLIISFTPYEKDFLISQGIEGSKICVIGCGVDSEMFHCGDNSFRKEYELDNELVVAYIGRRSEEKGVGQLIDAMKIVWQSMPEARLVLAGELNPDYEAREREKINPLSAEEKKRLILIGSFPLSDRSKLFNGCDVFAMVSNVESFGTAYLEAWACSKPIIACKNCPTASVVEDGKDGLLVEHGNANELASAILKLLSDERMRVEIGRAGREKALREYMWDVLAERIREQYYRLFDET